jgi:hypothetical protein
VTLKKLLLAAAAALTISGPAAAEADGAAWLTMAYKFEMKICGATLPNVIRDGVDVLVKVIPEAKLRAASDDLAYYYTTQGKDEFCSILDDVLRKQEAKNIEIFGKMTTD